MAWGLFCRFKLVWFDIYFLHGCPTEAPILLALQEREEREEREEKQNVVNLSLVGHQPGELGKGLFTLETKEALLATVVLLLVSLHLCPG